MNTKTLFLAWQDKRGEVSRPWFPVGRLDVEPEFYRFRYVSGAKRAEKEQGFLPLLDFPMLTEDYRSLELFPLFRNRIIAQGRKDRPSYLRYLDLGKNANPEEILSVSGGYRVTDAYEVFPKLEKGPDGSFICRFFLHGYRHVNETALNRVGDLKPGEKLYLILELTNPATGLAVQIQTTDYHMIGWTPRYLVSDLARAMADSLDKYTAQVVQVNPQSAPMKQRVLIEMRGYWNPQHEPMSGEDFQPLVGD